MNLLAKRHVALTASRKTEEMQELIRKQGGESSVRPMQGTVSEDPAIIKQLIRESMDTPIDWFIFTTGIGVRTFMDQAEELGLKEKFIIKLKQANVAVRGYKAIAVLRKEGIAYQLVSEDGTTKSLLDQLDQHSFQNQKVVVQLYGIASPEIELFFQERQAALTVWLPYHHQPPEEAVADRLLGELLVEQKYQAICFTTALQVKALFKSAEDRGMKQSLFTCLQNDVIATAVGKITAEALTEEGITRVVVPAKERMGAMIIHLGKYFSS